MRLRNSKLPKICVIRGPVDIGSMICDELCNLGFDAWTDKDGAYSQADVVIMPADSVVLELMRDRKISFKKDVVIVLWLVEPLPPLEVSRGYGTGGFNRSANCKSGLANYFSRTTWRNNS